MKNTTKKKNEIQKDGSLFSSNIAFFPKRIITLWLKATESVCFLKLTLRFGKGMDLRILSLGEFSAELSELGAYRMLASSYFFSLASFLYLNFCWAALEGLILHLSSRVGTLVSLSRRPTTSILSPSSLTV